MWKEETMASYECTNRWCNKSFSRRRYVKRHMLSCRQKSEAEKQCYLCKKSFAKINIP